MKASLKKQTESFIKKQFPELSSRKNGALTFLNSKIGGVFVLITVIATFLPGLFWSPKLLQWVPITNDVAGAILEQRISNLATVFSITLVLIGWLITNISSKESISYHLLFKRISLYPIFFFIVGLIISLIIVSSVKYLENLYIGNAIILGSFYVVLALIAITFLFIQLLRVVDISFFYTELRKDIMDEIYREANAILVISVSERIYKERCETLQLSEFVQFQTELDGHQMVTIVPTRRKKNDDNSDQIDSVLFANDTHSIRNVKLNKLTQTVSSRPLQGENYYLPLHLGMKVNEEKAQFYFLINGETNTKFTRALFSAFQLKKLSDDKIQVNKESQLSHLKERLMKDTKEGKVELMRKSLQIYREISQLQDKIKQNVRS